MSLSGSNISITSNGITNTLIANRTRRVFIPAAALNYSVQSVFNLNSGAATNRKVWVPRLGSGATDEQASFSFNVPADYAGSGVAGLNAPRMTILWGTDAATTPKVNVDISFDNYTTFTTVNVNPTFRYNFRQNAGAATDAMESLAPAAGAIVAQTMPEAGETWVGNPTWAAGDTIVICLARNGTSLDDPNNGRMGIVGVIFEYEADE